MKLLCYVIRSSCLLAFLFSAFPIMGQDLEPRSLSNAPVGVNIFVTGYGYSAGNILFDPSVPIEDAKARVHRTVAAYVRTIDFFGLSGKVDLVVPFVIDSHWEGLVDGQPANTTRTGFPDPMMRLSVNFIGAPALSLGEFQAYREKTIVGASLQIRPPLGQYSGAKLINLGSNRWTLKPQVGASHHIGHWVMEGYFSVWLFTPNTDFLGVRMTQKPIYAFKTHVAYLFGRGAWFAVDAGYGIGGKTTVDELPKESQRNVRLGATLALPLGLKHSIKFNYTSGVDTRVGADFETVAVAYQYRWWKQKGTRP
jgi:hypothetical protein